MKVKLFVFIGIVLLAVLLAGMYPVLDDFGVRSNWFMNFRSTDDGVAHDSATTWFVERGADTCSVAVYDTLHNIKFLADSNFEVRSHHINMGNIATNTITDLYCFGGGMNIYMPDSNGSNSFAWGNRDTLLSPFCTAVFGINNLSDTSSGGFIAGGYNKVKGSYTAVFGYLQRAIDNAEYGFIAGQKCTLTTGGDNSYIFGNRCKIEASNSFVSGMDAKIWGESNDTCCVLFGTGIIDSVPFAFLIGDEVGDVLNHPHTFASMLDTNYFTGVVGIGIMPTERLQIAGNLKMLTGGSAIMFGANCEIKASGVTKMTFLGSYTNIETHPLRLNGVDFYGDDAAGGDMDLHSTSNATKGDIITHDRLFIETDAKIDSAGEMWYSGGSQGLYTDARGADSNWIYNTADTFYVGIGDNPTKVGNSLIVSAAGDVKVSKGLTVVDSLNATTVIWWYCKYIDAFSASVGASGATWTAPSVNSLGGYQLNANTEYLYFNGNVCNNWYGSSDLQLKVRFEINAGSVGANDSVYLDLLCWYKAPSEDTTKYQVLTSVTDVANDAIYTMYNATFVIDWDLANNVIEVNDRISFRLNIDTGNSEIYDLMIKYAKWQYLSDVPQPKNY